MIGKIMCVLLVCRLSFECDGRNSVYLILPDFFFSSLFSALKVSVVCATQRTSRRLLRSTHFAHGQQCHSASAVSGEWFALVVSASMCSCDISHADFDISSPI